MQAKKCCYWLKNVVGDYIHSYLSENPLVCTDSPRKKLYVTNFFLHFMKYIDYATNIVSTCGTLHKDDSEKSQKVRKFRGWRGGKIFGM